MKTPYIKPLLASLALSITSMVHAQIGVSIGVELAPPELPVYSQPVIPGDGYMWTPGYWSWNANDRDYFWVPGTWVNAPYSGALWTPGYWEFNENRYNWHGGYWGDHIGYYGGINYGFGYVGVGYQGGYWDHGAFSYNRTVNNVSNVHVTNVYNSNVTTVQNTHASFNGGKGGVQMTASKSEQIINSMPHQQATAKQQQHETMAATQPAQRLTANHGVPKVAATPEAGAFNSERNEPGRVEQKQPPSARAPAPRKAPAQHAQPAPQQRAEPAQHQQRQEPRAEPAQRQASHAAPAHENEHEGERK